MGLSVEVSGSSRSSAGWWAERPSQELLMFDLLTFAFTGSSSYPFFGRGEGQVWHWSAGRRVRRGEVVSGVGHLCQPISARLMVTHSWRICGAGGGASDLRSAGGRRARLRQCGGAWRRPPLRREQPQQQPDHSLLGGGSLHSPSSMVTSSMATSPSMPGPRTPSITI